MSDWHNWTINELIERLDAAIAQREEQAAFAFEMRRERDAMRVERDALVRAIDDAMTSAHIGVFNPGDDPKDAINRLAVYEQGIGEYFMKAERDAAREDARVARKERDSAHEGWDANHKLASRNAEERNAARADRDRLAACVERVASLVNDHGWSRGLGADDVVTISTPDSLVLTHALTALLDYAGEKRAALEGTDG